MTAPKVDEATTAPVPSQAAVEKGSAGGWLLDLAVPVLAAALVCVAGGVIIEKRVDDRIEAALMLRPDLAVVDDIGLVRLAIDNGANRYNPSEVSAEIERIVNDAGLGNTILVSRSMVLYSPVESRIEVAAPKPEPTLKREIEP